MLPAVPVSVTTDVTGHAHMGDLVGVGVEVRVDVRVLVRVPVVVLDGVGEG